MLPRLVEYGLLPLHELIVGRATCAHVEELERMQWLSPGELARLQAAKLGRLLRHAFDHVPFYSERMRQAGIDPYKCEPLDALTRMPLLSREQVRRSLEDMMWRKSPGGLFRYNTGGSTGEPLIFYIDRRRQAYDQAARIRTHRWFGVRPGDSEIYLWGSSPASDWASWLKTARDALFNQHMLNAFTMSGERMNDYVERWNRTQPVSLFGYPSSIRHFVDHVRSSRRRLHCKRLKAVFVTGEVCSPQDRACIEAHFQVPVVDGYGSRDGGFIAHQCPKGRMHITAENVILEIIEDGVSPDLRPAALPGREEVKRGEIVLTHLDAYGMPFIRYRTGDYGRLLPGRCPCGRGLPLMDVVQGRTTDVLHLPDGTAMHGLAVIYPLRETAGVRQFRIVQHEDYGVTVEVVAESGTDVAAELKQKLVKVLGRAVPVEIRLVDAIPLTRAGKFRHVVSRAQPRASVEREAPGSAACLPQSSTVSADCQRDAAFAAVD